MPNAGSLRGLLVSQFALMIGADKANKPVFFIKVLLFCIVYKEAPTAPVFLYMIFYKQVIPTGLFADQLPRGFLYESFLLLKLRDKVFR